MKKCIALLLTAAMCLGLVACGADADRIAELEKQLAVLEYRVEQLETQNHNPAIPESASEEVEFAEQSFSDPGSLQTQISTLEDAVAYLDERFPELWMSAHLNDGVVDYWWLAPGEEIVQRQSFEAVGRGCIINAVTYLLCDDMEIYTVIGFRHDENGGIPMMAINCIKTDSGYRFVDPVRQMRGDTMSRFGALLPEAEVKTLEEYVDLALSDVAIYETLDYLYLFEKGERFEFYEDMSGMATLKSPQVDSLYKNGERIIAQEELNKLRVAHIKPENIGSYKLSNLLGGTTLTA